MILWHNTQKMQNLQERTGSLLKCVDYFLKQQDSGWGEQ